MKRREYIILPLLSVAVGTAAFALDCFCANPAWSGEMENICLYIRFHWFTLAALPLFFLGIPGTWAADHFRKYPERVRLSPVSFGLIAVIPAALIPGCSYPCPLYIGNIVMALTILSMARFKPGKRLGEFEPIKFRKTLCPFLISSIPLILMLFHTVKANGYLFHR